MPDPDRLLNTLHRATRAFRTTPGRTGRVVRLQGVVEVLVAGDLHGNLDNLRVLVREADLAKYPNRHLVLQELVHGPNRYPDGGDKSHQALDVLAALKCQFPLQVHMLIGNHELAQWTGRAIAKGEQSYNELFRRGLDTAYGSRAEEVYTAYGALFAALPAVLLTPNRVCLSHSLPSVRQLAHFDVAHLEKEVETEEDRKPGGSLYALVWGRDTSDAASTGFLGKMNADLLVSGHIACEKGFSRPNDRQLILDSLGSPACYCLFPADRPLTLADLLGCVRTIGSASSGEAAIE